MFCSICRRVPREISECRRKICPIGHVTCEVCDDSSGICRQCNAEISSFVCVSHFDRWKEIFWVFTVSFRFNWSTKFRGCLFRNLQELRTLISRQTHLEKQAVWSKSSKIWMNTTKDIVRVRRLKVLVQSLAALKLSPADQIPYARFPSMAMRRVT